MKVAYKGEVACRICHGRGKRLITGSECKYCEGKGRIPAMIYKTIPEDDRVTEQINQWYNRR